MGASFDQDRDAACDEVAAIVEAEILANRALAQKYNDVLDRCLLRPKVMGCRQHSEPSATGLIPMWLVLEEPPARGNRYFIAYDPDRARFGIGVWEGQLAWYVEDGGFFDILERLFAQNA